MFDIMPPVPSLRSPFVQFYLAAITLALIYWTLNILWYILNSGLTRLPPASSCAASEHKVTCCEAWRIKGLPVGPGCEGVCRDDSTWPFCKVSWKDGDRGITTGDTMEVHGSHEVGCVLCESRHEGEA